MDTSKTYIKMCEQAEEIQSLRVIKGVKVFQMGDWVTTYNITTLDYGSTLCVGYNHFIQEEFSKVLDCYMTIWLPHQAQLQGMLTEYDWQVNFVRFKLFASDFDHEDVTPTSHKVESNIAHYDSMEQLWLVFAMSELHQKKWNGKEWVK